MFNQEINMCRLGFYQLWILIGLIINTIQASTVCSVANSTNIYQCDEFESCHQLNKTSWNGVCKCIIGYERSRSNQKCIPVSKDSTPKAAASEASPDIIIINDPTSKTIVVFTSLFVILLILGMVFAVYYSEKRYRVITRLRSRLIRQNSNSYDEVMIGQDDDDPPLA